MVDNRLISFDLKAEFGFFKKPDINDGIHLTYNMLHKPALLGILGAIVGLQGYTKNYELPEYYKCLKNLKIGIEPLNSDKGNYLKDIISYINGIGFANDDGNLIISEQTIINPSYRCYVLLNMSSEIEKKLYDNLKSYNSAFLPYMGKNDFSAWWDNFEEYKYSQFNFDTNYSIVSIFIKSEAVSKYVLKSTSMFSESKPFWLYFEKLPISFDEELYQYKYEDFVYSESTFVKEMNMNGIGEFFKVDDKIVQLF